MEYNQTILNVHRNEGPEYRDSIELGTGKTGVIKVYGDASRPEEFRQRIANMVILRDELRNTCTRMDSGGVTP